MNKYSFLPILFFLGCSTLPKPEPPKKVETVVVLGLKIQSPTPYNNYSLTEINSNIDNSINIINSLNSELKELENLPNTPERVKKKNELLTKKKKVENLKKDWKDIGYFSTEKREKEDEINKLTNLSESNFEVFLDLKEGDFLAKITQIFGSPQIKKSKYVAYTSGTSIILEAYGDASNRIESIKIIGKEGFQFAKGKGIKDPKYKLLGLNASKIEEAFRNKLTFDKKNELYKSSSYAHTAEFYCPHSKNFTCESIKVKW